MCMQDDSFAVHMQICECSDAEDAMGMAMAKAIVVKTLMNGQQSEEDHRQSEKITPETSHVTRQMHRI